MTWANRITLFRIVLIPVFLGTLLYYSASEKAGAPEEGLRLTAFVIFLVAAISDGIDGYLARHWNQRTKLGAVLDPTADKLLAFTALLSLSLIPFHGIATFPLWFPLLVISRDVILAVGALLLHYFHHAVEVRPHWTGKVSTGFVFAAICAALLDLRWVGWLCAVAGLFTFASAIFYLRDGTAQFNAGDHSKPH